MTTVPMETQVAARRGPGSGERAGGSAPSAGAGPLRIPRDRIPARGEAPRPRTARFAAPLPPDDPAPALVAALAVWLARLAGVADVRLGVAAGAPGGEAGLLEIALRDDPPARVVEQRAREGLARASGPSLGSPAAHEEPPFEILFAVREGEREDGSAEAGLIAWGCALAFVLEPSPREARVAVSYDAGRFDAATVRRGCRHLARLCRRMRVEPWSRLSALGGESRAERHQVLVEWNDTGRPPARAGSLHRRLEVSARRTPDAVAVVSGSSALSYDELRRRGERLAGRLRRLGVGPETPVGLLLDRSPEACWALWGVTASGGGYLALDPALPPERLRFMLERAGARVVVSAGRWRETAAEVCSGVEVVWAEELHAPTDEPEEGEGAPAGGEPLPERMAYVLYTSGSTGEPKGVVVSRRGLDNHCRSVLERYEIEPEDRGLALASLSFDVSAEELFPLWYAGAAVVLHPAELAPSANLFLDLLARERVSVANLPASYWHALLPEIESRELAIPPALRLLVVGSEPVMTDDVARWRRLPGAGARLVNAYGLTETTIGATLCALDPSTAGPGRTRIAGLGVPTPGVTLRVLDAGFRPVPLGATGEIHVGGDNLARGYLGRPAWTAERFRPDPFSEEPGARLYATGDLGRFAATGNLLYEGRSDRQVKVRGYRVELAEVEAALREHPAVRQAVVLLSDGDGPAEAGGETRLERSRLLRRRPSYEASLEVADDGFLDIRDRGMRTWLLQRQLDELSDDLDHLDRIARRFVGGSHRARIEGRWTGSQARLDEEQLVIEEQQVMQSWERPLMRAMARIAAAAGGDVLELGFGMGISATFIQEEGVRSHTIVECNSDVIEEFHRWRSRYPDRDIRLVEGRWQDVAADLGRFDGVFFDTYPADEEEFREYVLRDITFAEHFFPTAAGCLRKGGVFTYYTNEIDTFSRRHQRLVFEHFDALTLEVVRDLEPPEDCNYWWADSMVVARAVR